MPAEAATQGPLRHRYLGVQLGAQATPAPKLGGERQSIDPEARAR